MFTNNLVSKFLLPVSLLIMLTSFSLSFFFLNHETSTIKSERKNYVGALARNLAYNSEYGALTKNKELLGNLVKGIMKENDVIAVTITDESGKTLLEEGQKHPPYYESLASIMTKKRVFDKNSGTLYIPDDLLFPDKNNTNSEQEKIGEVHVYTSLTDMQNKLSEVKSKIIDITLTVIIIAIAITFFLVRKITSPLQELVLATKLISDGELTHKVKVKTNDEIGKLSISFNKMTEELARTLVSRDYVDNIIKSMIDMLIVTTPDASIITVNRATTKLLGYSESELIGKPVGMLFSVPSEILGSNKRPWIDNLIDRGMLQNVEIIYLAKDGTKIPVILSGSVMKNENGTIQGFVYVALDITERKKAEEMARQSDERYRNLVETVQLLIFSLSVKDRTILSANPAFETMTGWDRSDWIGRPYDGLVHPDDLPLAFEINKQITSGLVPRPFELRLLKKTGEYITCDITLVPQTENGVIVTEFGIAKDISDQKKAEIEKENLTKQLLQSEKMAAVGQLAGGIAHEINNPLSVILGFAQSLLKRLKDEAMLMPLKSIEREANRCKYLVHDLLTFSRIGRTDKEKCDINEVVQSALSLIEAQTKFKSVELVKDFSTEMQKSLVSLNQLQQVIINLCNNAIDAMAELTNGKLTIRTLMSKIDNKDFIEIHVQDNGTGIPQEIQTKVFEPFFTTKDVGKGTGLGLSLVYEIVQRHHGRIELESEVSKGSTFKILLPVT